MNIPEFIEQYITGKDAETIASEIYDDSGVSPTGTAEDYNNAVKGRDVKDGIVGMVLLLKAYLGLTRDDISELNDLASHVTITGDDVAFAGDIKANGNVPVFKWQGALSSSDDMNNVRKNGVYYHNQTSRPANAGSTSATVYAVFNTDYTSAANYRTVQIGVDKNMVMCYRAEINNDGVWTDWAHIATREYIGEILTAYNSTSVKKYTKTAAATTVDGITYSFDNGVITVSGTAESNVMIEFEGRSTTIPSWVKNGKYYAKITKAAEDGILYQLTKYQTGEPTRSFFSSDRSGSFEVSNIASINGVVSRFLIPKGETVDNTLAVEILSAIPNGDIGDPVRPEPAKLRLWQNNIGKMNNGQALDEEYHLLTSENFDGILNNYKRLLTDLQPDIMGIEEFMDEVTIIDGAAATTASMNGLLYDFLYPYKREDTLVQSKRSVKSKYRIIYSVNKNLPVTYTFEGETILTDIPVIYTRIEIGNRIVGIACAAFQSGLGEKRKTIRAAQYPVVLDLLKNDEYAFLICDANQAGITTDGSPSASIAEGNEIINNIMRPRGYEPAMGTFFPWAVTWVSFTNGHRGCPDNIFYKNNGKVRLQNFKVLTDEFANLASDHIPVYADFILY